MLPFAKVIELTVTVFPVPTFLLLKEDEVVLVKVSDPINPDKERVVEAVEDPSYTLLVVDAVAVNAFLDISAVVDD